MSWDYLALFGIPRERIDTLLRLALEEDVPSGDVTTRAIVPRDLKARAIVRARQPLVLAGLPLVERVFQILDHRIDCQWVCEEGTEVQAGQEIGQIEGPAHILLLGERTALNILQRLCGIASLTRRIVEIVRPYGVTVLDTRKTTPLWRWAEKYAVRVGGGQNHRMSLSDGVLVKDNHLSLIGGFSELRRWWETAQQAWQPFVPEVEVRDLDELKAALEMGVTRILLDNMTPDMVAKAVQMTQGRAWLEVSGGITLDNVEAYAKTGVQAISIGALTHSAPAADVHMKVFPVKWQS